jgi:hypothetical protein
MYDAGKIIPGLIVFLAIVTFPIWYNAGDAGSTPNPQMPTTAKNCVRPVHYMRAKHMQLILSWGKESIRNNGDMGTVEVDGEDYDKGLESGCLECHDNTQKFCKECHDYVGVKPYCWKCHS